MEEEKYHIVRVEDNNVTQTFPTLDSAFKVCDALNNGANKYEYTVIVKRLYDSGLRSSSDCYIRQTTLMSVLPGIVEVTSINALIRQCIPISYNRYKKPNILDLSKLPEEDLTEKDKLDYVNKILANVGAYDFIFINYREDILKTLSKYKIPYLMLNENLHKDRQFHRALDQLLTQYSWMNDKNKEDVEKSNFFSNSKYYLSEKYINECCYSPEYILTVDSDLDIVKEITMLCMDIKFSCNYDELANNEGKAKLIDLRLDSL